MDGGDWVTLIVSIVTIMVSVFGAHELVRKQDQRRDTAELFGKMQAEFLSCHQTFSDFVIAVGEYHKQALTIAVMDPANRFHPTEKLKAQATAIDILTNQCLATLATVSLHTFSLELVIGSNRAEPITDAKTNCVTYVSNYTLSWRDKSKEIHNNIGQIIMLWLDQLKNAEDEMRAVYKKLSSSME